MVGDESLLVRYCPNMSGPSNSRAVLDQQSTRLQPGKDVSKDPLFHAEAASDFLSGGTGPQRILAVVAVQEIARLDDQPRPSRSRVYHRSGAYRTVPKNYCEPFGNETFQLGPHNIVAKVGAFYEVVEH